jgi:hypothetical protein
MVRKPAGIRVFSLVQNVQTASGAHPAFNLMVIEVLSRGYSGFGMKLTTRLHPVLRLISGAVLPVSCIRHGVDRDSATFLLSY